MMMMAAMIRTIVMGMPLLKNSWHLNQQENQKKKPIAILLIKSYFGLMYFPISPVI
jgi:hypothetical protein